MSEYKSYINIYLQVSPKFVLVNIWQEANNGFNDENEYEKNCVLEKN